MKIKLLIAPAIIIIAIIVVISFVYPAYRNGSDGAKDKYDQLKAEQTKLSGIQGKSGNAVKLSAQITALSSNADVLYEFMPKEIKNEEIIDNLNYLASTSGLAVNEITISPSKQDSAGSSSAVSETVPNLPSDIPAAVLTQMQAAGVLATQSLAQMQEAQANIKLSGNYDQLKNFLNSVDKLGRYKSVSYCSIKKSDSPDMLGIELNINFGFAKETVLSGDMANDTLFATGKLNTDIISKIKNQASGNVIRLDVGQKGKANPFTP